MCVATTPRQVYIVGFGLGLIGSLATAISLLLAGSLSIGILSLGTTLTFVLVLGNISKKKEFDMAHSLAYRVGNWGCALIALALGLLMLVVGIMAHSTFG